MKSILYYDDSNKISTGLTKLTCLYLGLTLNVYLFILQYN